MYPIHPAADVFPMIGDKELTELAQDIRANGLIESIKVCSGHVIDGRNRLKACEIACVEPRYETVSPPDVLQCIIGLNIHRRHLTTQQRAAIAAELANMTVEDTRENLKQNTGGSNDPPDKISTEQAAEMMNVSSASVKRAKQRMKTDPAAHDAAKKGGKVKAKKEKKPSESRKSWLDVAQSEGVMRDHERSSGAARKKIQAALLVVDPGLEFPQRGVNSNQEGRLRRACQELLVQRKPEDVAEAAAETASSVELTEKELSRLDRAIAAHKRMLDAEYEMRIQERVKVELQIMLDDYNAVNERHKQVIAAYKGVFTRAEYKSLLGVLHPDRLPDLDDVLKARFEKAFNLIKTRELELCGGDDGSAQSVTLPKTVADLMARRKGK